MHHPGKAIAVLCVLASAAFGGPDITKWKMAHLPDLDPALWGPVRSEPGHTYRAARATGRIATFSVPVWWGKSFRPPEGTVYMLRITYKDTATRPVIFYAHAGIAPYWGLSEIHRFGGLADNKWKVAYVPLSWDLICRKNVPGNITEFGIRSDRDLPVDSIEVTLAGPEAAERYFRETRQWVARQQAAKLKVADRGQRQKASIPPALRDHALIPFARTYLLPLMQNDAPQPGEAGATLKVRMAKNEYESVTFGVYANGRDLKNVRFSVTPLVGPSGTLDCDIDLRTAEYAVVRTKEGKYRTFPQRLWPAYSVDIPAGLSHWFWITIRTWPDRSKPGKYTGTVLIEADGASGTLPLEVEVVPVTLLTMQQARLELGSCIRGLVPAQDLKTLAEYNHTGMDIWFGGTFPQMTIKNGKLILDFTYMDDWMAYARKYGMTHMMWFLGGDPYGFPDTMNLERELYRAGAKTSEERNRLRREYIDKASANPYKVIPEIRDLYVEWVRQVGEHARMHHWPQLILHPFDEPAKWVQKRAWKNPFHPVIGTGPWIKDHFKDACALIRKGSRYVLVGGDIHHAEPGLVFVKDIDVFCTNAIHEDLKLGDKVRAAGTRFWQYAGCNDQSPPHRARFTFGFYFGAFDSRGSLVWAYNWTSRFDTSEGGGQWGFGWYTPFGTVPAPFMIGLREGFDDRRWIETYKARVVAKDPQAMKLLDEIGREAIAQRTPRGRDTVSDFYAEMRRIEKMDEWRNRIIDALVRLAPDN